MLEFAAVEEGMRVQVSAVQLGLLNEPSIQPRHLRKMLEIPVRLVLGFLRKTLHVGLFVKPGYKIKRFGHQLQRTTCG